MRPTIPNILQARANTNPFPGLSGKAIYQMGAAGIEGSATPQQKILDVTRSMGIKDSDIMQATTRSIFDTLPLNGSQGTDLKFFQGCQNRAFPFTNLPENKLEVGEAMIVEKIMLFGLDSSTAPIYIIEPFFTALGGANVGTVSTISLTIANTIVLKPFDVCNVQGRETRLFP